MKLKNNLKKIRKEKGLTQVQVAEKAEVSIRSYQNYEAGERVPDVYKAQEIANALNIDNVNKIFPLEEESASKE